MVGNEIDLPPVRIELTTPGLQDQCSATELKRLRLFGRREMGDMVQVVYRAIWSRLGG